MFNKKNSLFLLFWSYLIIFLVLISNFTLFFLPTYSCTYAQPVKSSHSYSTIVDGLYYLGKELGYNIDKEQLLDNLNYFGASPFLSEKLPADAIIKSARNQGIFLNGFRIGKDNWRKLAQINSPFLTYLKGEGYTVVKNIVEEGEKYTFNCILPNGVEKNFNIPKFSSIWDEEIFSLPLMGVMAKRLNSGSPDSDNRFVAIYAYHAGEDFEKFSKILDKLREEAERQGRKLIYLDELGLIPEESVKNKMKQENISKKKAFLKIKQSIMREDEMLEKGIPIHLPNPFYNQLFQYLAKYKIKSIVEDLDYNLWEQIVAFDNLKLHDKATKLFFTRNIESYIRTMREYTKGFWKYNVKKRDELYRKQIKEVMEKYPNALLFMLRGIGHYGMEEDLDTENFSIQTLVFAKGRLRDNLIGSQALHVLWNNEVRVEEDKQRMMFLKSFPQEALRAYFKDKNIKISEATRISSNIVRKLTKEDILRLSADIAKATLLRKIKKSEDVWEFIYNWMKENGKIPKEIYKNLSLLIEKNFLINLRL